MRGILRRGAVVLVAGACVFAATGTAGAASTKPKQVSTAKYVKTVCGVYSQLINNVGDYAKGLGTLDSGDPASFVPAATAQTNTLLNTLKADEVTLKSTYPSVSNGKKISALLVTNATELDQAMTSAVAQLQAGGLAGVTQFTVGINTLTAKLSDPFSKVTNQDLINAFQKEKLCKTVVTVTGG
jgi:hypothetical protein